MLWDISRRLSARVAKLKFSPPVEFVYNPLEYAAEPHRLYLERFGTPSASRWRRVLLLGMNPGPFGMAQTGVPFGEVAAVRDWMGIQASVKHPRKEHPKRPIQGFACERSEVSGARLWGWARQRFESPEQFFARFFVVNYCPLVFMEAGGKNLTPDRLSKPERAELYAPCDQALREIVSLLEPERVVGVGGFAEKRAREALVDHGISIDCILHPSPANPKANRGWQKVIEAELAEAGVELG